MASGVIQDSVSVAANAFVDDVLVNNILAFNRDGFSVVDCGVTASATGLRCVVKRGVVDQIPEFAPSLANRIPIFPDDFLSRFGLMPADRLLLRVRNTTAGALTLFWQFKLSNVNP